MSKIKSFIENYKYLKNSFNEDSYLDNISMIDINNTGESLAPVNINARKYLDESFIDKRRNNRKIYLQAMLNLAKNKIIYIYLPTALIIANVVAWSLPKKIKTQNISCYEKTTTTYIDGALTSNEKEEMRYVLIPRYYVDESIVDSSDVNDKMMLYILNGKDGFKGKIDFDKNGKVLSRSTEFNYYIDSRVDSFLDDDILKIPEENYDKLYDEIIDYFADKNLTITSAKKLKNIIDSDKKHIIIDVIKYTDLGKKETQVYSYHIFLKIFLGIMLLIDFLFELKNKGALNNNLNMEINDDLLKLDGYRDIPVYNLAKKYSSLFIEAERKRIMNANYLLEEKNVSNEDRKKLFTNFESKKLSLKK